VALLDPAQHLPAVDVRHHHVEKDELGLARLDRGKPLVGARRFLHVVALSLELQADELPHVVVVVDEKDGRARLLAAGAGPGEKRLEIAAPEAPVASRGVESGHAALIGPLANRALGDAEKPCGLPERQPFGVVASAVVSEAHRWEFDQIFRFLHVDVRLVPHLHGS
jgi:hypothetical protein